MCKKFFILNCSKLQIFNNYRLASKKSENEITIQKKINSPNNNPNVTSINRKKKKLKKKTKETARVKTKIQKKVIKVIRI